MKLIRSARVWIYAQVLLGVVAYGVASSEYLLAVFGAALGWLSWHVVEGPGGKPLPRWLINLGVLGVMLYLVYNHFAINTPLIIALGQFILLIQIFKLYERKANRDWGQLIVLSLMLMICAAIISAEVLFGAVLAVYLTVALFAVLLFQVKLGHDEVSQANRRQTPQRHTPPPVGAPTTSRYRRQFNWLAVTAGGSAVVFSALFFMLIPRGHGSGLMGDWQNASQRTVSGYNNEVNLSGGGRLSTSRVPIMNVAFQRGGEPVGSGSTSYLLRGMALDRYDADTRRWVRSDRVSGYDREVQADLNEDMTILLDDYDDIAQQDILTQYVTLRAQPRDAIFAAASPVAIEIDKPLHFGPSDQTIATQESVDGSVQYVVHSLEMNRSAMQGAYHYRWEGLEPRNPHRDGPYRFADYARGPVTTSPRVREYTQALLAEDGLTRDPADEYTDDDRRIAETINLHLQSEFTYALDIPPVDRHQDPIAAFLFDYQRGHCEFFASAMCAMLRSVGVRSRVITGFRASEYNAVGGYYVVRALNAHAWVEVWIEGRGWRTYDPSPPAELADLHQAGGGLMATLRHLYDFLEFQWVSRIITYDSNQQQTVMTRLNQGMSGLTSTVSDFLDGLRERIAGFYRAWLSNALGLVIVMIVGLAVPVGTFLVIKNAARQRRFQRRFGLSGVSRAERRRLTRQLDFYFQAVQLVERAGHRREDWQTPGRFARRLAEREPHRYQPFVGLTELFYAVRFGARRLDGRRRAEADNCLADLRERLNPRRRAA